MTCDWSVVSRVLDCGLVKMALLLRATYGGSLRAGWVSTLSLKAANTVDDVGELVVQGDDIHVRLAEGKQWKTLLERGP